MNIKNYINKKRIESNENKKYYKEYLFVGLLGHFSSRLTFSDGYLFGLRGYQNSFDKNKVVILEELSEKEKIKAIKRQFGKEFENLPLYFNEDINSVRYFRIPTMNNKIVPYLTPKNMERLYGDQVEGIGGNINSISIVESITTLNNPLKLDNLRDIENNFNNALEQEEKRLKLVQNYSQTQEKNKKDKEKAIDNKFKNLEREDNIIKLPTPEELQKTRKSTSNKDGIIINFYKEDEDLENLTIHESISDNENEPVK